MGYEKAYKEALERAKHGLPIDEIFPELKESEDERINKFLRQTFIALYLCRDKTGKWHGEPVTNILAYLEKQKEQQPAEWSEEDEKLLDAMIDMATNSLYEPLCPRGKMIALLKSIRPQPHWKPSEEQIDALEAVLGMIHQTDTRYDAAFGLLDELKAL